MKIVKIENGEIRHGFLIEELSENIKNKAVSSLKLEWLDETDEDTISDAMASEFLFDEEGDILPIYHTYQKGKKICSTYGTKKHKVKIS